MDEVDCLRQFGLHPGAADLSKIRDALASETTKERQDEDDSDTALLKLLCVQLFNGGALDDVLRIWGAKCASFDAGCSIDVQLLCGAGLAQTKEFLASAGSAEARSALDYLLECEATGDFERFSVEEWARSYDRYYSNLEA